jgi:hypothetical protein
MTNPTADQSNQTKLRTTGEVLARLQRLGLYVTPTMIADDTTAHYLPARETAFFGRDGASGLWEPWMEQRAERLYRLRALHRRSGGRGPSGDLLRLFLLLADGWGWKYVRETCIKGYRLSLRAATKGVSNRVRNQALTLENLWMFAEDIAEDQYRPQEPNQDQVDRAKMTLGLLKFGMPPDRRMGTIERFVDDLMPDGVDPEEVREYKDSAPFAWAMLNLGETEAIKVLESDVSDLVVKRAVRNFRVFILHVRHGFRKKLFMGKERPPSTNPLTAFGAAKHFRFQQAFHRMPNRATPAQLVGAQFAQALVIAHGVEQVVKMYGFYMQWLAYFLKSDACAQWMRQMESEISKQQ